MSIHSSPGPQDPVELEYERAILRVSADPDAAMELAIGLKQYRELYKLPADQNTRAGGERA